MAVKLSQIPDVDFGGPCFSKTLREYVGASKIRYGSALSDLQ